MSEHIPYPTVVVCFLLGNQFCERFTFYGMRSVLTLYITEELKLSEHDALMIYHMFASLAFAFPVVGAIIADSWWGKFKTIFVISIVYVIGNIVLALSAIGPLNLPPKEFAALGLFFIAVGSGGIKPCVAAFGGDQFVLPQQERQRESYFHLFYFAINCGSFLAMIVTPMFRKNVYCFERLSCYPLAFTVPAILMTVGVILFAMGKPFYKIKEPEGNMVVKIGGCIGNAVSLKCKSKGVKKDHWLDFAIEKHGEKLVNEIKIVLKILFLYLPLPLFWALLEQQPTAWTFQARRMNGEIGNYFTILPDQMQVFNPLMVLIFIPIINYAIYPSLALFGLLTTPLQKIATGGILTAAAFVLTAFIEVAIETTLPVLPSEGHGQIRIFNILPCDIKVTADKLYNGKEISISKLDFVVKYLKIHGNDSYSYSMSGDCSSASGEFIVHEKEAASYFFYEKGKQAEYIKDNIDKLISGNPNVRTIVNLNGVFSNEINIKFVTTAGQFLSQQSSSNRELTEMGPNIYNIKFGDSYTFKQKFSLGGVYTFAAIAKSANNFDVKALEVTRPNSIHILCMLPQYAVITVGECMLAITGIEFAYSQAPVSMKSVMQAAWLLTVAFGQLVVIIIESFQSFEKQSSIFFLYAAVMLMDMMIFILMALKYQYIEETE